MLFDYFFALILDVLVLLVFALVVFFLVVLLLAILVLDVFGLDFGFALLVFVIAGFLSAAGLLLDLSVLALLDFTLAFQAKISLWLILKPSFRL